MAQTPEMTNPWKSEVEAISQTIVFLHHVTQSYKNCLLMNHSQLFLNASTQMIFIVCAGLSVLRGFHVSTFLKPDNSQGRAGGRSTWPMPSS